MEDLVILCQIEDLWTEPRSTFLELYNDFYLQLLQEHFLKGGSAMYSFGQVTTVAHLLIGYVLTKLAENNIVQF